MDDASYGSIEEQLDFGNDCADSFLDGSEQVGGWLTTADETDLESTKAVQANGAMLRELHALLKKEDPSNSFGGLVRVQNKRREFVWVHEQFVDQY